MNTEPDFLQLGEVLLLQEQQLKLYGGSAGVRDRTVWAPQWAFHYGTEDLFELAAALL
jgi:hypothetical protein